MIAILADSLTVGGSSDEAKFARGGDFSAIRVFAEADAIGAVVVAPVVIVGVGVAVRNSNGLTRICENARDNTRAEHLTRLHDLTVMKALRTVDHVGRGGYEEGGNDKNLHHGLGELWNESADSKYTIFALSAF
jgi:hypothetical protein